MAATRRGDGGRWRVARAAVAGADLAGLRAAVDRRGRPSVLWSERRRGGFLVRLASRPSERAGWRARPPRIATPGGEAPSVALSPAGALVVWRDGGGVRAARTSAGAFERPRTLSAEASDGAAAAIGPSGGAMASWSGRLPGGTSVVLATDRSAAARGWRRSGDVGIGTGPVAAINDRGDAVVAWSAAGPGEPQGIEAATRRGDGRWRPSTVVARRECDCALDPVDVAVDGHGGALVGWRAVAADGGEHGAAAALAPGGRDWRPLPGSPSSTPAVAAGRGAGGLAAWVEGGRAVRAAWAR